MILIRTSVVDPNSDTNWIRIENLCGSVFRIWIWIQNPGKFGINYRQKVQD